MGFREVASPPAPRCTSWPQGVAAVALLLALATTYAAAQTTAAGPADPYELLRRARGAIEGALTPCSSSKFLECVTMGDESASWRGFMNRTVNGGTEATELGLRTSLTADAAARVYEIDAASLRQPMTGAQFWRTTAFDASPGQRGSGTATVWRSPADETRANAFGVLVCGTIVLNVNYFLVAAPSYDPIDGAAITGTAQAQVTGLMTQLGTALAQAGACEAAPSTRLRLDPIASAFPYRLYEGETTRVSGVVWAIDADGINHGPVATRVSLSGGSNIDVVATTDAQGYFEVDYPILDGALRQIIVTAGSPDATRYQEGSRSIEIEVSMRGALRVTAAANKPVLAAGESLTVTGTVTAAGQPAPAILTVLNESRVLPPASVGANGGFAFSFAPPTAPGVHAAVVKATLAGYTDGFASVNYLVEGLIVPTDACVPIAARVLRVTGIANVKPLDELELGRQGPLGGMATVNERTVLAEGMSVGTSDGARVAVDFDFGEGSGATVVVNGSTTLKIARFCRDGNGRVHAMLHVDSLGQVAVQVTNQDVGGPPLDFNIITPSARVTSVQTRYLVRVDAQGATTVAALEGAVLVSEPGDGAPLEVAEASLVRVRRGEAPSAANLAAFEGGIDPELMTMLSAGRSTPAVSASDNAAADDASGGNGGGRMLMVALVVVGALLVGIALRLRGSA